MNTTGDQENKHMDNPNRIMFKTLADLDQDFVTSSIIRTGLGFKSGFPSNTLDIILVSDHD